MAVGAAMSGVLNKIHVIPYVITVKWFGTKPHYPSQIETVPNYYYYFQLFSPNFLLLSHFIFMLCKLTSPIQTEERKIKLSPLLFKTSPRGNTLCIFGLGNVANGQYSLSLVCFRCPPCCRCDLIYHRGHRSSLPSIPCICRCPPQYHR